MSLLLLAGARASAAPDLTKQEQWTEKDKKAFLEWLKSGNGGGAGSGSGASGQVKVVNANADTEGPIRVRKARFLTLEAASDHVMTVAGNGSVISEASTLGPKVLLGTHLFSWVRLYGGAQYTRFRQSKLDNTKVLVNHLQLPVGLELALVPLGTPQTRYLILRGGVALHDFESDTVSSDFRTPLIGWQTTYNAGLGYEWQFSDSRWRVHLLAEGYKFMIRNEHSARFYGLGLTGGLVYTF